MKYEYRHHPSKLAVIQATFGAGSRVEKQKYTHGIAHFMEHFRFKGNEKYSQRDLTNNVAFYGGSWNAFTSEDLVSYHITIPEENIEHGFKYLAEVVLGPSFPVSELDKEKEVVCQEIRMYDDDLGNRLFWKLNNHIFGSRGIVGTEDSVKSITVGNLKDFDNEFYTKEHLLLTLVGSSNYSHLVEKYFGIPDGNLVYPEKIIPDYGQSAEILVTKPGAIQNSINVGFALPNYKKDSLAKYAVFNYIFGASDDSRLFSSIREDLGLVYDIGSMVYSTFDGSLFVIGTETDPENKTQVLEEIDRQINIMLTSAPTDEELVRAKNRIRSGEYSALNSPSAVSRRILKEVFYDKYYGSQFLADIEAVTAEDVQKIAEEVFCNSKYVGIGTDE